MAVTKRTRFEVLKRDNHTCQYCGEQAPNVTLHVDHVIPVSLGGTDKPDNLVAACKDCNTGKGSSHPDDSTVEEVNDKALAYSQALRENLKAITATYKGIRKIKKDLDAAWEEIAVDCGWPTPPPMDKGWGPTLHKWLKTGITPEYVEHAMEIALSKDDVYRPDVFRYFCGVIYRTLDEAHAQTQSSVDSDPEENWEPCGHCPSCLDPEDEDDSCSLSAGEWCDTCHKPYCVYRMAHTEGQIQEHMRAWHEAHDHKSEGKCGHCEGCLSGEGDCAVYHVVEPGDEAYKCSICGRQDCLYPLGIQDGMVAESRDLKARWGDALEHYANCPEVARG